MLRHFSSFVAHCLQSAFKIKHIPRRRSLSSLLASRLSRRSCLSISALILFDSLASSLKQQAIIDSSVIAAVVQKKIRLFPQRSTKAAASRWFRFFSVSMQQQTRREIMLAAKNDAHRVGLSMCVYIFKNNYKLKNRRSC